ncbi:MAG: FIST C-terminal domain-containing protein [Alphaproteobacteria bacterium]|nr:FIST C-terminal domain-containing protein [Alphaproteobacteria bacterium]
MKKEMLICSTGSTGRLFDANLTDSQLVIYFLSPDFGNPEDYVNTLRTTYPHAQLIGCTTGGEIANDEAVKGTAVSVAVQLYKSSLQTASVSINGVAESRDAGKQLGAALAKDKLRYVFVLSDGLMVNGSELTRGMVEALGPDVIISGGLAGDGTAFKKTGVGLNGIPQSGIIAAVGFYGDDLLVSYGTYGGWQKFGPNRKITKAENNILYELDNKPALDLYKSYLGPEASKLPGSGLLFPLSIRATENDTHETVRTIVGINEDEKSLIFAGEVTSGYVAQLMHGSTDQLISGAQKAAESAKNRLGGNTSEALAILVSCIGRSLLMGQSVTYEVEAVKNVLGEATVVGFYSYGEISHHEVSGKCGLHNQTMTISLISERA